MPPNATRWLTMTHTGRREHNEDAFRVLDHKAGTTPGVSCCVVCDGLGGHVGGEIASQTAAAMFMKAWRDHDLQEPRERLRDALEHANLEVGIAGEQHRHGPEAGTARDGMGTTLAAAEISGTRLHWITCGDSTVRLWSAAAKSLRTLNRRHNHPGRANWLTSCLMGDPLGEVDDSGAGVELQTGDAVLVGSDGIDTLPDDRVAELLAAGYGGREIVEAVLACGRENQDNVTAAVAILR